MADEDKRQGLKRELSAIFNRAAANKVVQVNEMVNNFDNLSGTNFTFFERGAVTNKVHSLADSASKAPGVLMDAASSTYVTPEFLKQGMLKAVDRGEVDGYEGVAKKMAQTAVEAIERSADQSEKVKTGQIKPKTP